MEIKFNNINFGNFKVQYAIIPNFYVAKTDDCKFYYFNNLQELEDYFAKLNKDKK